MKWEIVELDSTLRESPDGNESGVSGPGSRWGHTCNSVRGGQLLYVFGGYGRDNCHTNHVYVFDTVRQTWSMPMMKGNPPSPRDSHSCTTVGDNLFVFGGTNGRDPLQDLHILYTASNTWISPSHRGEGPAAREGHSAALVGKQLFIFGGCGISCDSSDEVYYNDVYVLDTETLVWERAMTSGVHPSARDSHTVSSWKNKIIVVAGEDADDYYLSDVHILDTDTLVWRQLSTSGETLLPRAGHSTVSLGKSLFVFGGFSDERNLYNDLHILDLETGIWTKVIASGQGPSARFCVAADCLGARKGVFVFIGGCNKDLEALDDMYYLYTGIMVDNGQDEPRPEKISLRKELKRKCQEEQHLPASLPANNKDVRNVGPISDMPQISILPSYRQTDKKDSIIYELRPSQKLIFEAKVTQALHYGYAIETNINGKCLHGIVFSFKPGFGHAANSYLSSRKNTVDEVDEILHGNCKSKLGIAEHNQQEVVDHYRNNDGHVNESTSEEFRLETSTTAALHNPTPLNVLLPSHMVSPAEIITATPSNNSTPINVSLGHMGTVNSEISALPASLKDDRRHDQPNGGTMFTSPSPRDGIDILKALAAEPTPDTKET